MAVKIRLTRKGKKKQPTYRVVVADGRSPRDGRYIEQIGRYDPRHEPSIVEIDNDRATYWLSVGAQPSDAVRKLLEISGALEARPVKINDAKVHVVDEVAQAVDAQDDQAVIDAAAVAAEEALGEVTETDAAEAAQDDGGDVVTETSADEAPAVEEPSVETESATDAGDAAVATTEDDGGDDANDKESS